MSDLASWERFKKYFLVCDAAGMTLDISRMNFSGTFFKEKDAAIRRAFVSMELLEAGAIANPDENRMAGHYWLRDASRAPSKEIAQAIKSCLSGIRRFVKAVHSGKIKPQKARLFKNILVIGIGGSALGPQFVAKALGSARGPMTACFFDNTDPDGMDAVLEQIGAGLKETLVIVISKSGGTKETRNGMLEAKRAYAAQKLKFEAHAVAITQDGSELDKLAVKEKWIARFPMWDWVGGRTSVLSAVGLLPAALQGIDILGMLDGAKNMDEATRRRDPLKNPAALMALMWLYATDGRGARSLVVLPYKDRLELFSKYLQQLIMESLGKEKDLSGKVVCQGLTVYGNKGSTDQHAYVQQLRDGINNFFVTFIEVLKDRGSRSPEVEPGVTTGDFLSGFFQGTRRALSESNRESMTITVESVSPPAVGALIALYERAVGLYAALIRINAYHQPGVEAGKKAASAVIGLQRQIVDYLHAHKKEALTAEQVARKIGAQEEAETVFKILQHLSANSADHGIKQNASRAGGPLNATYSAI